MKPNILDRAIMTVAPVHAAKRAAARAALSVINSGYGNYGANLTKKSMRGWMYHGGSAKEDIEDNIDILRQRSRDAYMGIPTATAALKTMRTNVVAGGLMPAPQLDSDYLGLDEAAADFPRTRFVMCHFGNPFLEAAAAVLEKNPNVCADLSGLLEGRADLDRYFVERAGYVGLLRTWMDYLGCWDRFLYGTDWPIVNLAEYRDYVTRIVPEERRPAVFFDNANRVYGLGL